MIFEHLQLQKERKFNNLHSLIEIHHKNQLKAEFLSQTPQKSRY